MTDSTWSCSGQEEFDRLRSLSYAETHVIMICFSVRPFISTLVHERMANVNFTLRYFGDALCVLDLVAHSFQFYTLG